jgi:fatty-acyl-CoA synthase
VLVQRDFVPEETLLLMAEQRVSTQLMVPARWAAPAGVPDIGRFDLSALRWILCGGAACPLSVIEYFTGLGRAFMEGFGMTELSPAALVLDAEPVVPHAGSAGRPFTHVGVRPVDEQDRDVALGVVGEPVLRGLTVFAGYWGRPAETAAALRAGWLHSGDLGVADADGLITLVDRKKDMIISGGENICPIEVERVPHRYPAVADIAVIGVPEGEWGEAVLAAGDVPVHEPIAYARERLAHFKCPRRVEFVDTLPRNATGKLLKRVPRERYTGRAEAVSR